tara:strand:- start:1618 stop:2682 length:1065 start_codon:yes stop_codon:yes gene_type:complete
MGKQVKTPRFYVDMPTFLHATGQLGWDDAEGGAELLYMNPSNPYLSSKTSALLFYIGNYTNNTLKTSFPVNFIGLLNHNLGEEPISVYGVNAITEGETNFSNSSTTDGESNILNTSIDSALHPTYNGTSIYVLKDDFDSYYNQFHIKLWGGVNQERDYQLGSFVVGKYWDAPNSPDLSLTMSRRFDGIKKQKTIGGKTLANIYYDGPTEWTMNGPNGTYKYPPFELDLATADDGTTFNQIAKSGLGRKGLRSWKLTFSYIAESDMWMDNEVSNTLTSDDVTPNDDIPNPMLSDDSFNFVWNCTLGGTLPFIFTDDKDSNAPDRYAICNFRGNSLSVTQVAHNTYKLSITIDEVA